MPWPCWEICGSPGGNILLQNFGLTPLCQCVVTSQILYGALRNFSLSTRVDICDQLCNMFWVNNLWSFFLLIFFVCVCFTNTILNTLGSFLHNKKIEVGIFRAVSWFFHKWTLKVVFAAQFLDFAVCFGHRIWLFSFSCEGQENLWRAKAEGRDADSDIGPRDGVVKIYGKYCQAGGETGTLLGQHCSVWLELHRAKCTHQSRLPEAFVNQGGVQNCFCTFP